MTSSESFVWEKLGLVFEPAKHPGRAWMAAFAQAPATLLFDDFVRVYFSCRPEPDARGQYVSRSAFVDLDRKDLTRVVAVAEQPILPLGGLGEFDEFGTYPVSVTRVGEVVRLIRGEFKALTIIAGNVTSAAGVEFLAGCGANAIKIGQGPGSICTTRIVAGVG
ncbi:hypothetical protein EBR16_06820, partial [bacterium]|nr:hypothetical protein [bacterium]